jgi:hypothetical protein
MMLTFTLSSGLQTCIIKGFVTLIKPFREVREIIPYLPCETAYNVYKAHFAPFFVKSVNKTKFTVDKTLHG